MPIIRKKLYADEGGSSNLRYDEATDTVQYSPDGTNWYDAPELDPRFTNHLPARTGGDPRCDAADNLVANIEQYIDENITAMTLGAGVAGLASILFSRLPILGAGSLLLGLIQGAISALLAAGASALTSEFNTAAYDNLRCYFYCHMDSSGRLTETTLWHVEDEIYNYESATVYNIMRTLFAVSGFGQINDWATVGTATGDCSACDCSGILITYTTVANPDQLPFGVSYLNMGALIDTYKFSYGRRNTGEATGQAYNNLSNIPTTQNAGGVDNERWSGNVINKDPNNANNISETGIVIRFATPRSIWNVRFYYRIASPSYRGIHVRMYGATKNLLYSDDYAVSSSGWVQRALSMGVSDVKYITIDVWGYQATVGASLSRIQVNAGT